ncbi:MAG: hypothetical protein RBS16_01430 [Candidatus Cloacimonadales bacterium]|jgi:hypothetical protein|nr:hypothetical protein [Candidatus Cloacimonadales bacterium]
MRKRIVFLTGFISILLFLLSACTILPVKSALKHPKKAFNAKVELKRWQSFKMEGIAEVQLKMFTFRKNFVVTKDTEAMRIDVLDSGIFGLGSSNISIYIDSEMNVFGYLGKQYMEIDDLPHELKHIYLWLNNATIEDLSPYLDEILETNSVTRDSTVFKFTNQIRLKEIHSQKHDLKTNIDYDYSENINNIALSYKNTKFCDLKIDKISYNNISVIKP